MIIWQTQALTDRSWVSLCLPLAMGGFVLLGLRFLLYNQNEYRLLKMHYHVWAAVFRHKLLYRFARFLDLHGDLMKAQRREPCLLTAKSQLGFPTGPKHPSNQIGVAVLISA